MVNADFSLFFNVANEVISDVDVFRSIVVLRIVDKLLSALVVD